MPRKKIERAIRSQKIQFFLFGVIVALAVIFVSIRIIDIEVKQKATGEVYTSLGSMQYDFSSGRAVERTDETVKSLHAFLVEKGNESVSENCPAVYHNVALVNDDETQVRLAYGCGHPTGHMFAVSENGGWRTLSPTNKFDMTGVPECSHVNDNAIDVAIAPVCFTANEAGDTLTYSVR